MREGAEIGRRYAISSDTALGREGADVTILDPEASRCHAKIHVTALGLELEDLESRNGTLLNGKRLSGPARLSDHDEITIGRTVMGVRLLTQETLVSAPALVIMDGALAGNRVSVREELVLGRERADIVLADPEVSRAHATVRPIGRLLELRDLDSANGTYVDGVLIDGPRRLVGGELLRIGNTTISVDVPAGGQRTTVGQAPLPEPP